MKSKEREYEFHPLCLQWPEYTPEVYAQRLADYREHPERADDTAVVLAVDQADGEDKIVDGRHHYRICRELGYPVRFDHFKGTTDQLGSFVIARNAHRRHITASQIAASIVGSMSWVNGTNQHKTKAKEGAARAVPSKTQQQAADEAGVSTDTIQRAAKVADKAPEVLPAVRDGKLDAKTAAKVADLPKKQREKIVASDDPKAAAKKALTPKGDRKPKAGQKEKPAPAEPPAQVDAWGIPIQPHAEEAFAAVPLFAELARLLKQARAKLTDVCEVPGGFVLQRQCKYFTTKSEAGGRWSLAALDNALAAVEDAVPRHTDCPYHFNPHQKHEATEIGESACPICHGRRVAPDLRKRQIPPELIANMKAHYAVEGD